MSENKQNKPQQQKYEFLSFFDIVGIEIEIKLLIIDYSSFVEYK